MLKRTHWHPSLTDEKILATAELAAVSLDCTGLCLICGVENDGVEPDARRYFPEARGSKQVYGVEELIIAIG
jgi:hypothetical protein